VPCSPLRSLLVMKFYSRGMPVAALPGGNVWPISSASSCSGTRAFHRDPEEAPSGIGALQWFIECDFSDHYFTLFADAPRRTAT
jgi:hypothetical protein